MCPAANSKTKMFLLLQPFRCAHCHYSCNISGSLKRHYNKKHPNVQYTNAGTGMATEETVIEQGKSFIFLQYHIFIKNNIT